MIKKPRVLAFMAAISCAGSGCYDPASSIHQLVDSNKTATGWVSFVNCNNHGAVYYAFSENGQEYRARAPSGTLDCRSAKPGDKVLVYYSPANPRVNTILTPSVAYARAKGWYVPEWAWICIFIAAAIASPIVAYYRDENRLANRNAVDQ